MVLGAGDPLTWGGMPDLFDVIADPTRRELLRALLEAETNHGGVGEVSVGELVGRLSLSQPTVSKHLKTLRDFSIVTVREQGQHRYYRLAPHRLEPIAEWLGAFLPPAAPSADLGPAEQAVEAVAQAAPARPLPGSVRALGVRLGVLAASVTHRASR